MTMKKLFVSTLVLVSFGALAQETGRVISSTPVIQQVVVQRQPSGAGAFLGALAGAGVGNAIGGGSGHALAIGLGTIFGAAIGDNVERRGPAMQNMQNCSPQSFYENRTVGYNVTYE